MKTHNRNFFNIKYGFTLAEVLITLVIIGVIAALTIPNIVYETKKHEYTARLKKFYSTLQQVRQKAQADGKSWQDWAVTETKDSRGLDIIENYMDTYLLPYISYVKTKTSGTVKYVYLNDGSYFYCNKGDCIDFVFDVNGEKPPNQRGRDIFVFLYCISNPDNIISRVGWIYSRSSALTYCKDDASTCSTLLMIDGWEFKNDYPYRL